MLTQRRLFLLTLATLICPAIHADAQAGRLDPTFAKAGIFATTNGVSSANAVAVQSDGKIVIAGTGTVNRNVTDALIRLNSNGTLDASFGSEGVVNLMPPTAYTTFGFFALAIQPDGKIVAASAAASAVDLIVQVARVETDGSLDTSFGTGGFTPPLRFRSASAATSLCSPMARSWSPPAWAIRA